MNLLTYEEVLELHRDSINEHGGSHGIIAGKEGTIHFAIEQPIAGIGDQDYYHTIEDKTAAMGYSLAMGHCFNDGNKRIAFSAMYVFLQKNGYFLDVEPKEAIPFMLALAAGEKDRDDLADWINAHLSSSATNPQIESEADERLSFGDVSPLSARARQIEAERPSFWKVKIFAQVLTEEIERCAPERAEHRAGYSTAPKRTFEQFEFFKWMGAEMNKRATILENQGKIIGLLSSASFSESVENGNLDFMISFARELGGIYKEAIEWSQQFRQFDISPDHIPLLEALATYFENFLRQTEQLPRTFLEEIEKAERLGEGADHIQIVLSYNAEEPGILSREWDALQAKLGLEDEHGLSADDYLSQGLSGALDVLARVGKPIVNYVEKSVRWLDQFDLLETKPAFVAKPGEAAIISSATQCTISTTRTVKAQLANFESHIEVVEKYGALIGNLINPASNKSVESARVALAGITDMRGTCEDARRWNNAIIDNASALSELSPRLSLASKELLDAVNTHDDLLVRLMASCDVQIGQLEAKLPKESFV